MRHAIEDFSLDVNAPEKSISKRKQKDEGPNFETMLHVAAGSCDADLVLFLLGQGTCPPVLLCYSSDTLTIHVPSRRRRPRCAKQSPAHALPRRDPTRQRPRRALVPRATAHQDDGRLPPLESSAERSHTATARDRERHARNGAADDQGRDSARRYTMLGGSRDGAAGCEGALGCVQVVADSPSVFDKGLSQLSTFFLCTRR
jgi:hypothetical protein